MCDWEAEEYAEHLLWLEAESVRARTKVHIRAEPPSRPILTTEEISRESAEA